MISKSKRHNSALEDKAEVTPMREPAISNVDVGELRVSSAVIFDARDKAERFNSEACLTI